MSKRHDIFTENSANFFQMQEKLETCHNTNLTYFRRPSFLDDINATYCNNQWNFI